MILENVLTEASKIECQNRLRGKRNENHQRNDSRKYIN